MQFFFQKLKAFIIESNKKTLLTTSLFVAILIFINYHFDLDPFIRKKNNFFKEVVLWFPVLLAAFSIPYGISSLFSENKNMPRQFFLPLILGPLLFACKLSFNVNFPLHADPSLNIFWNYIVFWPLVFLLMFIPIYVYWKYNDRSQPFYGFTTQNLSLRPYFILLLLMIPLIAAAATQQDFQAVYPKLKSVTGLKNMNDLSLGMKLLFEISYGIDFINIELFFRGFLVLAFIKFAGKDVILPMACFYCTIHFGKPLAECISSYFGGIILGVIVYHTRSIYGGLLVHLGIAWLMELAGYLGNVYR
jgi:hypothetical protein